jgi:hypothetical protein
MYVIILKLLRLGERRGRTVSCMQHRFLETIKTVSAPKNRMTKEAAKIPGTDLKGSIYLARC